MKTHTWDETLDHAGVSQEDREASRARARKLVAQINLADLRKARKLTQQALAEQMEISQASVSELEHRTDAYVSTLRRFVKALGGELQIVARFPAGDVVIDQFAGDSRPQRPEGDPAEVSA